MKFFKFLSISFLLLLLTNPIFSEWIKELKEQKSFIENRGQYDNRLYYPGRKALFVVEDAPGTIFFAKDGISYRFDEITFREENKSPKELKREKLREVKEILSGKKTHHEIELEENAPRFNTDFVHVVWENANENVEIIPSEKLTFYHNYSVYSDKSKKNLTSINYVPCYRKITYKNLYDNIDVIYELHPENGIKYSVVVHPGGDISKVRQRYVYPKKISLSRDGKIIIKTKVGDMVEHAPVTFYASNGNVHIPSSFKLSDNVVTFQLGHHNPQKTIVIDPWVNTPAYNTSWRCSWECERDGSGNVYVIGGVMPMQLLKYNGAGVLQWTYNTPYDTSNSWLGTFAVDNAGNSYVTAGSVAQIQKVSTNGTLVWNNPNPGGIFASTEFWNITFNCDETRLIIGGTGGTLPPIPYIYEMNMNNGNVLSSLQVTGGELFPTQEVRAIAPAGNGKYYFLTHDSFGFINQNFTLCGNPINAKNYISNTYTLAYQCENFRVNNTGICALKAYNGFAYVNRGNRIDKRSLATLAIVASAPIPGGAFTNTAGRNQVENSGIDIDNCGNIYVGSKNRVIKFDENLNQLQVYPTAANYNVYDIAVRGAGNEIIVCGSTGTSSSGARTGYIETINTGACNTVPIVCCDASMCRIPPLCLNANPVTITVSTPGGTFSGPGVNPTTGVFNPATAGVGTHKIIYTLPCGSDSIFIVVNSCTALSVCRENNGNLRVSGGDPAYTWSYWQQASSTPITNQAQCTACGGTWVPFVNQCLVNNLPATTCNSPAQWVQFATGTSVAPPPGRDTIRVVDNAGTQFVINGLSSVQPCNQCPPITVSVQSKQDVTCANPNSGSVTFTATGTTGSVTYTWSPATGSNSATATGLSAGTYNVTVRDANNCTGTGSVTINTPPSPTLTFSNQVNPGCNQNNGSVSVTIGGGTAPYQVTIDNGQGGVQTINVPTAGTAPISGLAAGNYTVTLRDANQCTTVRTLTLTSPNAPVISNLSTSDESCIGANDGRLVSATVSGGSGQIQLAYAPASNPGNIIPISGFPVNGLSPGNYIIIATDANNCSATRSFIINPANSPCCNIVFTKDSLNPTCNNPNGGSAQVNVTPQPGSTFTYAWGPLQGNTNSITGLSAGFYTVTITQQSSGGNTVTDTLFYENFNSGASNWVLNTGTGTNQWFVNNVYQGGSCIVFNFPLFTVPDVPNQPAAIAGSPNSGYLHITATTNTIGCAPPFPPQNANYFDQATSLQYAEMSNNISTVGKTNVSLNFWWVCAGSPTNYGFVQYSTNNGATWTNVGSNLQGNGSSWQFASISNAAFDNQPQLKFRFGWTNGAGGNDPAISIDDVRIIAQSQSGSTPSCSTVVSFQLRNTDGPTLTFSNVVQPGCNQNNGSLNATISGGLAPYQITVDNGQGNNQTVNVPAAGTYPISGLPAGSYTITVRDANNCTNVQSLTLSSPAPPTIVSINTTPETCAGDSNGTAIVSAIGGTGNLTYQWSNNASTASISNLAPGTYTVTVRDAANCTATGTAT
ncbi:MAG: hypothetical protein RMJ53_03680, partial [Chitinophagales bacterium]|nr:hypothetical protein [Chitinophagales bacterium]